jgi:hypothetical protein
MATVVAAVAAWAAWAVWISKTAHVSSLLQNESPAYAGLFLFHEMPASMFEATAEDFIGCANESRFISAGVLAEPRIKVGDRRQIPNARIAVEIGTAGACICYCNGEERCNAENCDMRRAAQE